VIVRVLEVTQHMLALARSAEDASRPIRSQGPGMKAALGVIELLNQVEGISRATPEEEPGFRGMGFEDP
jgi:hypothetical protein